MKYEFYVFYAALLYALSGVKLPLDDNRVPQFNDSYFKKILAPIDFNFFDNILKSKDETLKLIVSLLPITFNNLNESIQNSYFKFPIKTTEDLIFNVFWLQPYSVLNYCPWIINYLFQNIGFNVTDRSTKEKYAVYFNPLLLTRDRHRDRDMLLTVVRYKTHSHIIKDDMIFFDVTFDEISNRNFSRNVFQYVGR